MKVVILAGGFGTRLSEYTRRIPKPMVKIDGLPIIERIMKIYQKFGYNKFICATGYKHSVIKKYFQNKIYKNNVKVVYTGLKTATGGRLLRLKKILKSERFFLTYGDALADINIKKLLRFHISGNKIATVTAVHPIARFGEIKIKNNLVINFKEKPQTNKDWINGGFFVFEPAILKYIKDSQTMLEEKPLEILSKQKNILAYKHHSFWHCMDNRRDKEILDKYIRENKKTF